MVALTLTERDREILATISGPTRLLTVAQVSRTFWKSSKAPTSDARKRLDALKDAGLIETCTIMARPELSLPGPAFSWPENDPNALGQVAYRLKSRWTKPLESTRIIIATSEARRLLGARPGREIRRSETTHDVHLAGVYLDYRRRDSELAARWVSGDELLPQGFDRVPDAVIRDDRGEIARVIDFAGSYGAGKLRAMHAEFSGLGLPYELW